MIASKKELNGSFRFCT